MLKKRNELLEAESAELADRLVRGQVSRAEEEETSYAIQSELLALRRAHLEVSHQLETANEEVRALSLRLQENVSKHEKWKCALCRSSRTMIVVGWKLTSKQEVLFYLI